MSQLTDALLNVVARHLMHTSVGGVPTAVSTTNRLPVTSAEGGSAYTTAVALSSPPANLTAGANTVLTFASTVYRIYIENNTTESKGYAVPSPATAGSKLVFATAAIEIAVPGGTTTLGIYGAVASALNGSAAGNLIVEGYA